MTEPIRFYHRNAIREIKDAPVTRTVLQYLREDVHCTGTKEGCAEGDCGACTVVLGERNAAGGVDFKTVNACIQFVPTLDGKALFTVEDLRQPDGSLHPVQEAMVECHGSQCGFCTPGFVMSMWSLYEKHGHEHSCANKTVPSRDTISNALTGNLCRCTGYRPIVDAAVRMFEAPPPKAPVNVEALAATLAKLERTDTFHYQHAGQQFDAPRTVAALAKIKEAEPATRILAGSTDIGLWVTKMMRELGNIVYIGQIAEFQKLETNDDWIEIGAGVSVEKAYTEIIKQYPELFEMQQRFASLPIRNAGTLGGNIANGSPIGDSMPGLIALGAHVIVRGGEIEREMPLEDLYLAYQKKDMAEHEFVVGLKVPTRTGVRKNFQFRTYKLSKRFDSDISAVCAAFSFIADGDVIREPRIAFGGMAATSKRATHAEAVLRDAEWHEATAQAAMIALGNDYAPLSDMRATSNYRLEAAKNTLYRFWLETRPNNPLPKSALDVRAVAAACAPAGANV
ncbi:MULTISPECIES: xanthine dehydrogenase small subunit [Paraburkholderia]|uniref:Xanthine dehydrogenase small subunit n=2 Tax=Paraburkholderia TaxID=1822464 RepID=A0A7Y9WCV9_9BURK|nr:xanthine dehydrogenase small subunit [Paraburkholderia bryophila]NYH18475.1 xanthine dehydrogenase small subunit [Paraburkholderia bryophila]NYH22424.1 xanthine dehydrogenase small subunit [Paraburkholderia bryophila]